MNNLINVLQNMKGDMSEVYSTSYLILKNQKFKDFHKSLLDVLLNIK